MPRGLLPTLIFAFSAIVFFSLGNLLAARAATTTENDQIAALRAEVGALRRQRTETSGPAPLPGSDSGVGVTRVHSSTLSGIGSPEATP